MDSHELTTRISQKLKAQGIEPDSERIEAKINRLVSEFGVPPAEAERTILQDIFRAWHHGTETRTRFFRYPADRRSQSG